MTGINFTTSQIEWNKLYYKSNCQNDWNKLYNKFDNKLYNKSNLPYNKNVKRQNDWTNLYYIFITRNKL